MPIANSIAWSFLEVHQRLKDKNVDKDSQKGMVMLTFKGIASVAGCSQVMQNFPSGFAEVAMEVTGLDVNAPMPSTRAQMVYDSHE